jgi:plastocyanin
MATSANSVYLVWEDRGSEGKTDIFLRKSDDNGTTFANTATIINGTADSFVGDVTASGDNLMIAWTSPQVSNGDVYLTHITNKGTSVDSTVNLSNDKQSFDPDVNINQNNAYVTWISGQYLGNSNIFLSKVEFGKDVRPATASPTRPSTTNAPTTGTTPAGGSGSTSVSIVSGASSQTTTAFTPNPLNVKVGDTVTWTNDDSQPHTITSGKGSSDAEKGKVFDSSPNLTNLMAPKATFKHTFTAAGTFEYFCQLHPNMVGTVNVS